MFPSFLSQVLLWIGVTQQCLDGCDCVYGLLGRSSGKSQNGLTADYHLAGKQLFLEVTELKTNRDFLKLMQYFPGRYCRQTLCLRLFYTRQGSCSNVYRFCFKTHQYQAYYIWCSNMVGTVRYPEHPKMPYDMFFEYPPMRFVITRINVAELDLIHW